MADTATIPAAPSAVAQVFHACPAQAQPFVDEIRELIFETASYTSGVGPLTETLKWGQPAYLTGQSKSGTTLRLGWDKTGTAVSLFVHCQTSVADQWRAQYEDDLEIIGTRELRLKVDAPLPRKQLGHCIAMALTYHSRKTAS